MLASYFHDQLPEDAALLHELSTAYAPTEAHGKLNAREFLGDVAGYLWSLLLNSGHDECCARFYFRFYDYDSDGCITREELSSVVCASFGAMGQDLLDTMKLLQEIDTNGDGELSKEEYLEAAKRIPILLASIYICI
ncbi:hypothetical protein SPRG_16929 [Saprolegnia parasitica CBS 223.65]|nr:hypothetical protein SPRG_16929 [Saprolegnia parasitica CBS 223.65]KDO17096.1 hypothetical protein SPRG_16929 [Saprolegnia parasitica CBS 223.65]|eukprot:XP_012212193.1 hypothetical protein SPRG_16929 [Saprolegnia parasitica CBS 223.65]